MKISPIKTPNKNNLNFKSTKRAVYKDIKTGKLITWDKLLSSYPIDGAKLCYRNTTSFFRDDLSDKNNIWKTFALSIGEEFQNAKKVNVYDFACSDGSETYSLAISLIEELQNQAQKFFPILAYDIDEEVINTANKNKIGCSENDIAKIRSNTNDNLEKYFNLSSQKTPYWKFALEAKPELRNKVQFKQGDILDEADKIEPSNSLILCRNFWPYLDSDSINLLISKLTKIDSTSRIVIGLFDDDFFSYTKNYFYDNFIPIKSHSGYIYKKRNYFV